MSDELTKAAGNDAPPHILTHKGREYKIPRFDLNFMLKFSDLMHQRDKDLLAVDREDMGPELYSQELAKLRAKRANGEYDFKSQAGQAFTQSAEGAVKVLELLTGIDLASLTVLLAERAEDLKDIMISVLSESLPPEKKVKRPRQRGHSLVSQ